MGVLTCIVDPQDTLDLFATLIVSLQLGPHKQFFRNFPNSFNTYVANPFSLTHLFSSHSNDIFCCSNLVMKRRRISHL